MERVKEVAWSLEALFPGGEQRGNGRQSEPNDDNAQIHGGHV